MDETDLRICHLLIQNGRMLYQEVADRLGINVQMVHRRVRDLIASGVIGEFTAKASLDRLGAVAVDVLSSIEEASSESLAERLSQDDRVSVLHAFDNNTVLVSGVLHNISEREDFTHFVATATGSRDPMVGLLSDGNVGDLTTRPKEPTKAPLTRSDLRMIAALSHHARRSVDELALDLRMARSTTIRQLQRLIDQSIVDLSIDFCPDRTPGPIALFLLRIRPDTDQLTFMKDLKDLYGPRLLLVGHLADPVVIMMWSKSPNEQTEVERYLTNIPSVVGVRIFMLQKRIRFITWVDKLSRAELPGVTRPML